MKCLTGVAGDERLAKRLTLPAVDVASLDAGDFYLLRRPDRLELCRAGVRGGVYVRADEVRRRLQVPRRLELARACGLRQGLHICDATAGLGVDGLTLAALGARVVLIERCAVLHALLEDAVARLRGPLQLDDRVELVLGDAAAVLPGNSFDVVLLDPMFPPRGKSALPNKRAQFLADLLGGGDDQASALLPIAQRTARSRVVVKRRRRDTAVAEPDWQIVGGRSVRFDVYVGAAAD